MSNHTLGDWKYDGRQYIWGPNGEMIGEVRGVGANLPMDDNGKLLAAGPKLLRVLKLFMDDVPCRLDHHGYCQTHSLMNPCEMKLARDVIAEIEKPILKRRKK